MNRLVVAVIALALLLAPATAHARKSSQRHGVRLPARASESRRGRPRKFVRPSRAVTVTLPDDVVAALQSVNPDLSFAVVDVVQHRRVAEPLPIAELVGGARQVIVVPPSRALPERLGVELVPLPDGRALIAFDDTLSMSQIELRLADAMADPSLTGDDRALVSKLGEILRRARGDLSLEQRNIIVLRRTRPRTTVEERIKRAV